ncbi:Trk system potassium transporter TrkA [Clostridiaceae bacterium NSJ-31]|uniref:Trk system potassium uptake protein TrkA n=1 Tax=Ligaoa zhengdingensis TaxID=2763658 RepID=A0A926E0X5_9FIRM|nr:Trk system potassium transporter TrkA [Ligaoa zhengdingensis]MBC8546780.1 Trk system potassium transporter TrkA [Ligaoa zhengdingensis]
MRIVIVGDGKVGQALVEQLSKEGHSIVIIDSSSKVIDNAVNAYDVMGINGNGASRAVQLEAGVNKADLLIAATSSDELNLLSCMVAKKIGARHTIARVRDPEYSQQLLFLKDELGLSMVVNPEMEAANEISRILRFPSALKIDSFARGRVDLVEIKLPNDSPLDGMALSALPAAYHVKILVCIVQREGEVVIPNGSFVLRAGDKISLTGAPNEITSFFRQIGIFKSKVRSAMIVGGGRIGYYLARDLIERGMHVKIIELDESRSVVLSDLLPKAEVIHGDGSDQDVLEEEGIGSCDGFVALTGIDEENIIVSMYAASRGIGRVVTKINRMSLMRMLGSLGIESVISPKYVTANRIVRYVRAKQSSIGSSVETLYQLVDQQVEALEFHVKDDSSGVVGIPLKDLPTLDNLLIACIVRDNRPIIPGGNDTIRVGDNVIIVTSNRYLSNLSDIRSV